MNKKINKVLIANRGEIACRVMRTAKELGISTVAVYSDADKNALHVETADEAYHIGPAQVSESYLVIDKILEAATATEADAIHPGYGFLSENTTFAKACEDAGIIFIGPSAHAIELMGDKARAKRAMLEASVPCIPGYQDEDQSDDVLTKAADEIGYPLMIKAAAGGGGRGMRLVHESSQVQNAIETARSEAISAFGAGELILEKAIIRPRHVEVQVFSDQHGNVVYLGERDCSVQRRHQKVIEEAPCPVMTPELREAMGSAAVAAAKAVDYVGAGTVEFLLGEDSEFYFLEMNTRLQVEHPVTELVTGLDLVDLQFKVASGQPLGFDQSDVTLNGHAVEIRLYAEDPANDFLPSTGMIEYWREPQGSGVRVDAGVKTGNEVSPFYDPMIAKVIAYGPTRDEARHRLVDALGGSTLIGPANNRDFLIDALNRESFITGEATTAFIEDEYGDEGFSLAPTTMDLSIAALIQCCVRTEHSLAHSTGVNPELINWSSGAALTSVCVYRQGDDLLHFVVSPVDQQNYRVTLDEEAIDIRVIEFGNQCISIEIDNKKSDVLFYSDGDQLSVATGTLEYSVLDIAAGEAAQGISGSGQITAPMHGQLLEIFVSEGQEVNAGDRVALLEAMKMQHEILADVDGTVSAIHVEAGHQIAMDTLMIELEQKE